ncbi:MAG: imidazole glycerol phosphate synthase subunit HisF [Candidatus Aminicenantes bacterium]|nr:imidazole glycerol phosphate synthase subunit HisF [Candidatus Aminicenantes bacterium]
MLTIRIIPCLDVLDGRVVKGKKFKKLRDAGDPVKFAQEYSEQGADEIIFLDIGATYRSRKIMLDVVEKVSRRVFVPLTVGGGIQGLSDIRDSLNAGADKVSVCSAALKNPELLASGAETFGSQCIVLSIDAKKQGKTWQAYSHGGRLDTHTDVLDWSLQAQTLGAGEILLNSIDMDGTKAGYDLELTRKVSEKVSIPVIASGGAGSLAQVYAAVKTGKADAVLIASLLHFREFSIGDIKSYLKKKGVKIR